VKRCPTCNRTFTDRNLTFCVDDGTPLITVDVPDEETVVSPYNSASGQFSPATPPPYQPPGSDGAGDASGRKRKVWPWIVGLLALFLLVVGGLIVAAVILIPRMAQRSVVTNTNRNSNVYSNENTNRNTPANEGVESGAPTDEAAVLSALTELEHEWTVANINADKTKLNRILADDYVGTTVDGKTQGKADYLKTIERDTVTKNWEFDDLEVDLLGDRATLTGVVRFEVPDGEREFRFVDKFVWRDSRWQATSSVVTPVQ
jgi:Domain of unknown function (DUF4440)